MSAFRQSWQVDSEHHELNNERDRIFNNWLADHKGILFKVVHAYAFEHADRQDLFQEIVIQVWRSVDAFRGDSSVPTWMYRVALNTAIAWTRKEGRHQRGKQPFEVAEGLLMTASADGRDPRVEWLYHQIAQLKDVDRSVALLLLDGFSYKEIAAIVGLTESNVGVKIVTPGGPGAGMVKLDKMTGEPVWMAKELSKTFCRTRSISGRLVRRIHETPNRAVLKQGDRRCG